MIDSVVTFRDLLLIAIGSLFALGLVACIQLLLVAWRVSHLEQQARAEAEATEQDDDDVLSNTWPAMPPPPRKGH